MPKFSAYMKGGDGTVGPPGASIIDGVLADESMLPIPNQGKYAFLVGTSDPKTLWVWDEPTGTWKNQGTTASKLAGVTASITTLPWSTTAVPSIQTQFSTSNQLDYFNFDFTIPEAQPAGFGNVSITTQKISYTTSPTASVTSSGDNWNKNFDFSFGIPEGVPAGFGIISATSARLSYTSEPTVSVTTSGSNLEKNFDFSFGIPEGIPGGFSTNQPTTVSTLEWDEPATVEIIPNDTTPNDSKSFNFKFGVPRGRAAGFGTVSATVSTTNWDVEPSISTSTNGEDWAKNIDFNFTLPTGRPAGFGEISVTTESLSSGSKPNVSISTDEESPDYAKDFYFKFAIPEGVAAGFSTGQHVSVSTLDSGEDAIVEITTVTSSPETAKEFNFHFGLPRGDALAIYEGIPFTTEDGVYYHWDTTNTTTLVFNRGTVEKLPIYIYNSDTNESIAATFKLSASTIEYETDEKFSGTMYLAMPTTLQNVEIGTVSSTTYGYEPVVSKSTGSTSTNIILDFVIPEGYPGHEIIDSLTTKVESISTKVDNKINQESIANIFTTTQTYVKDDYVVYNNKLYQFQVTHTPGDWIESQVLPALAVEAGGGGGSYVEGVGADVKFLDSISTLAIMPSDRTLEPIENSMAIISNGNNHISISTGQYVYVKKDSDDLPTGVPEGLYTANTNISANETLTTNNLNTVNNGGLNDLLNKNNQLEDEVDQLNDKTNKLEVLVVECGTISSLPQTFNSTNGAVFAKIEDDMVVLQSTFSNPSAATSNWTVTTGTGQLTISGSIASGSSTTLKLYLMKSR